MREIIDIVVVKKSVLSEDFLSGSAREAIMLDSVIIELGVQKTRSLWSSYSVHY